MNGSLIISGFRLIIWLVYEGKMNKLFLTTMKVTAHETR